MSSFEEVRWVARLLWLEGGMAPGEFDGFYQEAEALLDRRNQAPPANRRDPFVETLLSGGRTGPDGRPSDTRSSTHRQKTDRPTEPFVRPRAPVPIAA